MEIMQTRKSIMDIIPYFNNGLYISLSRDDSRLYYGLITDIPKFYLTSEIIKYNYSLDINTLYLVIK